MSGGERNDHDRAAPRFNHVAADNGIQGIIPTLHQHVRPHDADQFEGRVLGKHDDGVDGLEGGQNVRPLSGRPYWAGWTLETADRVIIVDAHEKRNSKRTRGDQHVNVSGVQQVEHTIGEHESSANAGSPSRGSTQRQDLFGR